MQSFRVVVGFVILSILTLGTYTGLSFSHQDAEIKDSPPIVAASSSPTTSLPEFSEQERHLIEIVAAHAFPMLPLSHQASILEELRLETELYAAFKKGPAFEAAFDPLASLSPFHQSILARMHDVAADGISVPMVCFAPGTPEDVVAAFNEPQGLIGIQYNAAGRWTTTAVNGSGLGQGDPTTLTYSFVPDGTFVPDRLGFSGNSDLFAFLNGIYGSPANWQPLYAQVFERWAALSGLSYQFEPNDDGRTLHSVRGVLGTRGDLRLAGIPLDGNSNILAYNSFPNDGDMVIDTSDGFYLNTSNNSLRLRNVLSHEHGHGMGDRHVCPIDRTKLMEPFINLGFDGPQHDDIRIAQRLYGDIYEDNDTPATATPLSPISPGTRIQVGRVPRPNVAFGTTVSIDANGDQDFYRVTATDFINLAAAVQPVGTTYDDSPQACPDESGDCCSGNFTDSKSIANLNVDIRAADGTTVLAVGESFAAGLPESATATALAPGDYYVRVYESDLPTESQLYLLAISATESFEPLSIDLFDGLTSQLVPGVPETIIVQINPGDEVLMPGSETLHYRFDDGAFVSTPLEFLGDNLYSGTLPAAVCDEIAEFYFSASGDMSGQITLPITGPANPFVLPVLTSSAVSFDDNFESDLGWVVSGDASAGHWNRGIPVNNDRGDPPADSDSSGRCYLTDNNPSVIDSDVDNGTTYLTSPVIDLAYGGTIAYDYWLNQDNALPINGPDAYVVEIATNAAGTNFVELRRFTTALDQWRSDVINVGLDVPASPTIRMRVSVSDLNPQNIIEGGLDHVVVTRYACTPGDCDSSGTVDIADHEGFVDCLVVGDPSALEGCGCFDLDIDGQITIADYAQLQLAADS